MNNEGLWVAPEKRIEQKSYEEEWFYTDPIFNLCIQLSYLNASKDESYGSVATQMIGDKERVIGIGWNIYMGGDSKLKRQGYANHAEFQAAALAETLGYNLNSKDMQTTIYVAGRVGKDNILFLNPESVPFTCTVCTTSLPKYFSNVHLANPSIEREGWRHMSILEAHYGALHFKNTKLKREGILENNPHAKVLNIDFTQEHMDSLINNFLTNSYDFDWRIRYGLLGKYEEMLNLGPLDRRAYIENLVGDEYRIYRGRHQSSLVVLNR